MNVYPFISANVSEQACYMPMNTHMHMCVSDLSLCVDAMIYIENFMESKKEEEKILELISEVNKVAGYKFNIQK